VVNMVTPAASTPAASGWSGSDYGSAIGAGAQIGGSIASGIIALLSSMRESSSSKMARGKWEGLMTPVNEIMNSLYNNPAAQGVKIPYSWNAPGQTMKIPKDLLHINKTNDAAIKELAGPGGWSDTKNIYKPNYYKFAPNAEMQSMYSNFLGRNYGISNSVANSMVAGSLKPLDVSKLGATPSVAGAAGMYRPNAQSLTTAAMGAQTPGALRQQDYLNNAANLSAFNLQRAKTLGDLIG
jgi:hypothetical protein